MEWHRGHVFHVTGEPDVTSADDALVHASDGGILVADDGTIAWSGRWADRPVVQAPLTDHHGSFLLPGFIDTHLHFPQLHCVDAYGGGDLLSWLDSVVFPAEARLADPVHARECARTFCDRLVAAGTTTAMVFGSQFPDAQEALVEEVRARGLRMVLGRTLMTVGPDAARPLLTSEADAIRLAREEVERWHPVDMSDREQARVQIAVVPRFALSVTPATLMALGELARELEARGVYVTTHLSESHAELVEVGRRYGVHDYLDVYDGLDVGGLSLLGRRSVFAHAVHCSPVELERLTAAGASVAHCPVSQGFLGSGTLQWRRVEAARTTVSLGTDIAAGDEWFMPRVLNACFKAHMNEPLGLSVALTPAELLYLATVGGARALDMEDRIGNLDVGRDADFVVLDPSRCPELDDVLQQRREHADAREERDALLFALLMSARQPAVAATYVRGRRLATSAREGAGAGRG